MHDHHGLPNCGNRGLDRCYGTSKRPATSPPSSPTKLHVAGTKRFLSFGDLVSLLNDIHKNNIGPIERALHAADLDRTCQVLYDIICGSVGTVVTGFALFLFLSLKRVQTIYYTKFTQELKTSME